jgi:hypothetical protein
MRSGVCRSATLCAAESKQVTTTAAGAVGCKDFPGPVQCCTEADTLATNASAAAATSSSSSPASTTAATAAAAALSEPKFEALYPLIVGDVDSKKAAFSYRTRSTMVKLDIRPAVANAAIAPISVTLPSALAAIGTDMENQLGMLPLVPATPATLFEARARRVPVFARTHTLVYVPEARPGSTPLASAELKMLGDRCYVMTLLGQGTSGAAYRAVAFEDTCPTLPSDEEKAYVRFLATKPGVSVKELKTGAADRLGAATAMAAKATTFTSSEGKTVTATLLAGHAYIVAVAWDSSLRIASLGDLRGDVNDARDRIARLYAIDGLAKVSESVVLTSSVKDVEQSLKNVLSQASANDRTVNYWVDNLVPNTEYIATVSGTKGEVGRSARFRTAGDRTKTVTFGVTSCLGPDNRPWGSLTQASKAKLDFMLLNGDTVYADGSRMSVEFRAVWADALRVGGLTDLFASTSVVAIWDDHETNDDWDLTNTPNAVQTTAKRAYKEALPAFYGRSSTASGGLAAFSNDNADIFRKISYGAVDLFVLDTRSSRNPSKKEYVSRAQLDWFKAEVKASTAPFKFIANTIPVTNMDGLLLGIEEDNQWSHANYAAQRSELLSALQTVPGVLFLSGDFHFGGLFHVGDKGTPEYGIFELLSGPGGSQINPYISLKLGIFVRLFDIFDRQFTKIITTWTFTKLTCNPLTKKVLIQFVGDTGKIVWATELDLSAPTAKITGNGWSLFRNDDDDGTGDTTFAPSPAAALAVALVAVFPLLFVF